MVTTTAGINGLNPQTTKVMNYMAGARTPKQIVGEFFGLREEAVYDEDGDDIVDYINDFKDESVLRAKGVHYHPNLKLPSCNVSEETFNQMFYGVIPNYARKKQQSDTGITTKVEEEQGLSIDSEGTKVITGDDKKPSIGGKPKARAKRVVNNKK